MQIYTAAYVMPVSAPPIREGALAVHEGRIVAIGELDDLRRDFGGEVRDFADCIIMPGLVNAHTHLELTHFPAWKIRKGIDYSPRTYVDWIIQVIKIKRALGIEEREHSVREGIRKSLEAGTTCVGEIVTDLALLPLYSAYPLAGRLYCEAIGQSASAAGVLLDALERSLGGFPSGDVRPGLSPHSPHTLSSEVMSETVALARRCVVPTAIHLSESLEEVAFLHDSGGRIAEVLYPHVGWDDFIPSPRRLTSAAWLDSLGVLDAATTLIHCVHVTPADVEIFKQRGSSVVLCPRSNDRLAVGTAPAFLLKQAGIPLALGTDSLASNDSLSLWDEMRFCRAQFPGLFSPSELLQMATYGGAHALSLTDIVGSLQVGKRADFLAVTVPGGMAAGELAEAVIEEGTVSETFVGGMTCAV